MSVMGLPWLSSIVAVVMSADRTMAGVQSGCFFFSNAATPATCGHAMEVPETMLKLARLASLLLCVRGDSPGQAARMFAPGAMTSGLRISRTMWLGPRDEKDATTGARFSLVTVRKVMR